MKKRTTNRLNMIGTTITICEQHSAAWSGIPAFAGVLNQVRLKKKEVDEQNEIAATPITGVTEDLLGLRKNMTQLAVRCASATSAYANTILNYDLAAQVNFTANKMSKMSKEKACDRCQAIKDAASANLVALAGYGITTTDITDLQTAINTFRQKIQTPRLAIIKRSSAKRKIAETVRAILDNLLTNQLDHMAAVLMFSNPPFYRSYLLAREIIDLGVVHTKIKTNIIDQNKVPLEGVKFTVLETETQKIVRTAVSAKDGSLTISPMSVGNFDFMWHLEGYISKTETGIHIAPGKVVRRKVTMKSTNTL